MDFSFGPLRFDLSLPHCALCHLFTAPVNLRKKLPFILLEVLMAMTLVILFVAPLMRYPIQYYRGEINRLEAFEKQRLADWTFSEVKELLLKESIPWDKLPEKKKSVELPLSDVPIRIPHFPSKMVHRKCSLLCTGEKIGKQGEIFRLYQVEISLNANTRYQYRVLVERTAKD